ncbi:uncharacterized protein CIMG_12620 [Coccidioides immitis RS]|uniref:Uncharacterized protein n=1 Tax=Coccidioides immitis (strain RS) TaxID=246410 RepID=A0A0D8JUJ9_COCIM|nr:uncharacterized protein CIMG_12620 [Coccidioides immitis RS]KJF59943.1 hypothetical protein CIMG_12620 [Coccidioides immitis RS]
MSACRPNGLPDRVDEQGQMRWGAFDVEILFCFISFHFIFNFFFFFSFFFFLKLRPTEYSVQGLKETQSTSVPGFGCLHTLRWIQAFLPYGGGGG